MDSTPKTRLTLIDKIKDSADAEAWTEFTAIYYPLVFEICRRKGCLLYTSPSPRD